MSHSTLPQRGKNNRNGSTGGPKLTANGSDEAWKVPAPKPTAREMELDYIAKLSDQIAGIAEARGDFALARAVRKMTAQTTRSENHIG